jgi:aspartyl-tRNA(Asn)/glutamyl-tRNA(Gln) amidotransferase subunit A
MSGPDEICRLDATELAARIRLRELSPVEVMAAHLDRIEARNPGLNALVTPNPRAEAEALLAERDVARGRRSGPLHGVPFTVKDSFDIAGLTATRGSRIFENHVPAGTATAVQRLQDAGGILLGKTNLPEFARSTETDNLVFGTTVHPLDAARTPGGSSGGEAAAVAAGLSPLGVGSDLCGSVRLPAHYCGIVGFKPTHGRIPLTGHWPQTLQRFDHVGPMARSVRDVRLALELMEGPDGQDWFAASAPPRRGGRPPVETLRIGWLGEEAFGPVADEITRAVAAAAAALTDMVGSVQRVCVPALERHDYDPLSALLNQAEGAAYFERVVAGRTADLSPRLQRSLARSGPTLPESPRRRGRRRRASRGAARLLRGVRRPAVPGRTRDRTAARSVRAGRRRPHDPGPLGPAHHDAVQPRGGASRERPVRPRPGRAARRRPGGRAVVRGPHRARRRRTPAPPIRATGLSRPRR